jgi:hypothetical protein
MNFSNLFVLGLLLLTANLSLGALFAPARSGRAEADRLLLLWKLLLLAAVQIGAWAIVLDQGGAAPSLAMAFTRAAACFALIGGSGGGLAAPWGEVAPFIALNGLLYILVSLMSLARGHGSTSDSDAGFSKTTPDSAPVSQKASPEVPAGAHPAPTALEAAAPSDTKPLSATLPASGAPPPSPSHSGEPGRVPERVSVKDEAETGGSAGSNQPRSTEPDFKPGGFRATIPKAATFNAHLTPEEELAEQMKPVGPTPPPIRFQWRN